MFCDGPVWYSRHENKEKEQQFVIILMGKISDSRKNVLTKAEGAVRQHQEELLELASLELSLERWSDFSRLLVYSIIQILT